MTATTSPRSIVPNYVECRALDPELPADASYAEIVANPRVREEFVRRLATFNAKAGGSSERFKRILLLDDPPSLDSGEMTDKGSINQRAAALRAQAASRGALRIESFARVIRRASAAEVATSTAATTQRGPP